MSSPSLPSPPDIQTYAAFYISTVINTALLGVLTIQTYYFYANFPDETLLLKLWIAVTFVVHYAHTMIAAAMTYITIVTHFPDAYTKQRMMWMPMALETLEAVATSLTQIWFARRQYLLVKRGKKWTAVAIVVISLVTLGSGIAGTVSIRTNVYLVTPHNFWFEYIWLGGNILGDIMVTVPIALSLRHTRTAFTLTNRRVMQVTQWIVTTGILTTTVACIVLILYVTKTESVIFVPIARLLSSLYANSLLAFLNRRSVWEREAERESELHFSQTSSSWSIPLSKLKKNSSSQKSSHASSSHITRVTYGSHMSQSQGDAVARGDGIAHGDGVEHDSNARRGQVTAPSSEAKMEVEAERPLPLMPRSSDEETVVHIR